MSNVWGGERRHTPLLLCAMNCRSTSVRDPGWMYSTWAAVLDPGAGADEE